MSFQRDKKRLLNLMLVGLLYASLAVAVKENGFVWLGITHCIILIAKYQYEESHRL